MKTDRRLQVFVLTAKNLQFNCIKKHLGKMAVKLTDRIVQLEENDNYSQVKGK